MATVESPLLLLPPSYTEFGDDVDIDEQAQALRLQLDELIQESVHKCEPLAGIQQKLTQKIQHMDAWERLYCEKKILEHCKRCFFAEILEFLDAINTFNQSDFNKFSKVLRESHSLDGLKEFFVNLKHYNMLHECITLSILTDAEEKELVREIKRLCWQKIITHFQSMRTEYEFIIALRQYVKDTFLSGKFDTVDKIPLLKYIILDSKDNSSSVYHLLQGLHTMPETDDRCSKLKALAFDLQQNCSPAFYEDVSKVLTEYKTQPSYTTYTQNHQRIFQCTGSCLNLREIAKQIDKLDITSIDEVRIIATQALLVNTSLALKGKNLVVVSPELHICDSNILWDLSGRNGKALSSAKAPDGTSGHINGSHGKNGNHGESGGNVLLLCDVIHKANSLTIRSNGGDGTNGQHGGNGKDGANGTDGASLKLDSLQKFNDHFSPLCTWSAGEYDKMCTKIRNMINVSQSYTNEAKVLWVDRNDYFLKGTTVSGGYQITFGTYCAPVNPSKRSYILVKGMAGTQGESGGDGGSGGHPGLGGYGGTIQIKTIRPELKHPGHENIRIETHRGTDGTPGKDGLAGTGGVDGKRGADCARIEPGYYAEKRHYYGDCSLIYSDTDTDDSAWCPYNKKYVRVQRTSIPDVTKKHNDGRRNYRDQIAAESESQVLRKASILVEEIRVKFSSMQQIENLHLDTQQESVHVKGSLLALNQQTQSLEMHATVRIQPFDSKTENPIEEGNLLFIPKPISADIQPVTKTPIATSNDTLVVFAKRLRKQTSLIVVTELLTFLCQCIRKELFPLKEESETISILLEDACNCILNTDFIDEKDFKSLQEKLHDLEKGFATDLQVNQKVQHINRVVLERYKILAVQNLYLKIQHTMGQGVTTSETEVARRLCLESLLQMVICRIQDTKDAEKVNEEIRRAQCIWQDRSQQLRSIFNLKQSSGVLSNSLHSFCLLNEPIFEESMDGDQQMMDESSITNKPKTKGCMSGEQELMDDGTPTTDFKEPLSEERTDDESIDDESTDDGTNIDDLYEQTLENSTLLDGKSILTQETERRKQYSNLLCSISNEEVKQMISKLQYIPNENVPKIAQILAKRFETEGFQISLDTFRWLITQTIDEVDENGTDEFIILFGMYAQKEWLIQYILLQIRRKCFVSLNDQFDFQTRCRKYQHLQILLFLSQQLNHDRPEVEVSLVDIYDIFENSQRFCIDNNVMELLQQLHISGWPLRLKWLNCLQNISCWKTTPAMNKEDVQNAAFYFFELENRYGSGTTNSLREIIEQKHRIEKSALMDVLSSLYRNKWIMDERTLSVLKENHSSDWVTVIRKMFHAQGCRSINDLTQLIGHDKNNSANILDNLDKLKKIVLHTEMKRKETSSVCTSNTTVIGNYSEEDVQRWVIAFKTFSSLHSLDGNEDTISDIIAVINQALYLIHGFQLRSTQMLALVIFICSHQRGILEQISTGEGKTLIIAALAIVKILLGENVDILTSSPILAERDSVLNRKLYNIFGIKVGHNASEKIEERKRVYTESDVIYGEIGAFQRDILQDVFYNEDNGIGSRKSGCLIVDEVDSMLLDKGHNVLYLSHSIPGMDALEPLYVYIWNMVHAHDVSGSSKDIESIKEAMLCAMFPTLRAQDIESALSMISDPKSIRPSDIWSKLIETGVIDKTGKLLNIQDIKDSKDILAADKSISCELKDVLLCQMKNVIRKGTLVTVPKSLSQFVEIHLEHWIKNAFIARFMQLNEDYIIDVDRSDDAKGWAPNIVIMDNDTGVEQYHSQWSNGLHQFLQLKHQCRLSFESLKAVFMSNVTFFKRYSTKLYGLSGTLGSRRERDFLKSMYSIDFATIPTFKQSQFVEKVPKLCASENDWLNEIARTIEENPDRPVLVICENVLAVDKIEKHVPVTRQKHIYKRSYEPLLGNDVGLDDARVIVATNLAGRGTDLKISDRISNLGGLHVCLTYLPANMRIEEQAFGRSARKGQKGSGQIICIGEGAGWGHSMDSVIRLKIKRNLKEETHIDELQSVYMTSTEPEENLFSRFKDMYRRLEKHLSDAENGKHEYITETVRNTTLQNTLDNWAFWLDEVNCAGHLNDVSISSFLKTIEDVIDNGNYRSLINRPAHKITLAKILLDKKMYQEAENVLKDVIEHDSYFADIAHYYMCQVLLRWKHAKTTNQVKELFEYIFKAKEGFNKKIQDQSLHVSIVSFIAKSYKEKRKSFLSVNEYEAQKRDIIDLYTVFIHSLSDITGYEVTNDMFETESTDPVTACRLIRNLFEIGVIQSPKVVNASKCTNIKEKYELYFDRVKAALTGENIRRSFLKNVLPSREDFWKVLKDAKLLMDARDYVLVDHDELRKLCDGKFESGPIYYLQKTLQEQHRFCNSDFEEILITSSDTAEGNEGETAQKADNTLSEKRASVKRSVCLHSEQLQEIKSGKYQVLAKQDFEQLCGKLKFWATLRRRNIIMVNAVGTVHQDLTKNLGKFDGITDMAFTEISGVSQNMSKNIFQDLLNQGVLCKTPGGVSIAECESDNIALTSHRRYETEVLNLTNKCFKYRLAFEEILRTGTISLPSKPHHELYEDLLEFNCIQPCLVATDLDEKKIKKKLQNLATIEKDHPDVDQFSRILANSVCGLSKFDEVNCRTRELEDFFDPKTKFHKSTELRQFYCNALYGVIILEESRWSTKTVLSIIAVLAIGMAQIALGIIIEVFSAGAMTFVATGLISEGINDIMFALECAYTGYFSWKSYAINKAISIGFTILTAGVGALLSRGAKFSKFGYKIGGRYLQHLSGRKLIAEVGKYAIIKQAVYQFGKKVATTCALSAASRGAEMISRYLQKTLINKTCQTVIDKIDLSALQQSIRELCQKVGTVRGKQVLQNITEKVFGPASYFIQVLDKVSSYLTKASRALCQALSQASQKTQDYTLSSFSNTVSGILKCTEMVKATSEIPKMIGDLSKKLLNEVRAALSKETAIESSTDVSYDESESLAAEFVGTWKGYIVKDVSEILTNELVKPIIDNMAHKLVYKVGSVIQDTCRAYKTAGQIKTLLQLKKEKDANLAACKERNGGNFKLEEEIMDKYNAGVTKLLQKTRDPQLYAEIIREGGPVGIHCVQAVAEALGRPIKIIPSGTPSPFPVVITPSRVLNSVPVEIGFEPGENGSAGHFSKLPNSSGDCPELTSVKQRNNCLFEAVSSGSHGISREQVASIIENDHMIQEHIRMGVHDHFMRKRAVGGITRTPRKHVNMKQYIKELPAKERVRYHILRDKAGRSADALKNTGNHELLLTKDIMGIIERAEKDGISQLGNNPQDTFDMTDVYMQLRLDTRYVVFTFESQDGSKLQGHPGALFSSLEGNTLTGKQAKGQRKYHEKLQTAARSVQSPKDVAVSVLVTHLNETPDGRQIKDLKYSSDLFTTMGQNLRKSKEREDFCRGVDRERYKQYAIAQRINGNLDLPGLHNPPQGIRNDWYCQEIEHLIEHKNFHQLGNILMKPAPYTKKRPSDWTFD